MASGTPHPSPQIGPQGPFLSSRTSTRPQKIEDLIESLLVFQKLIQQIFMWGKNLRGPIPIQLGFKIFHYTFTFIAASKKPNFEVVINVGFWPLSCGSWWRCCGRGFGFTLYPGSLSPLTIMSTPTIKPECKLQNNVFYVGWEITSILFMKLKIPTYIQFDLLLAF